VDVFERVALEWLLRRLREGRVTVQYWNGDLRTYGGTNGPTVTVTIRTPEVVRRALRNFSLAFGEAYQRGDVEIDESRLEDLFWILAKNAPLGAPLITLYRLHRNEANRRSRQRRQISHHYDIGNEYYELFLDPTLTYSCAYFESANDSLEAAQHRKIDYLLRKLQPAPGQRILDIGSGWGYLAVAAARDYDAVVLGITLSDEQLAGARALADREGVSETAQFRLMNYQDLARDRIRYTLGRADGRFDRVISVGMFEHVGRGHQRKYFQVVRDLLAPGGTSVLHTITSQTSQRIDSWVDRHIFPGGHLPTVSQIEHELANHGFWSIDRENLWQHYTRTLEQWRTNHQAHREQIIDMLDAEFYRMRDLWLAGSKVGFAHGDLGLSQFVFTHGKPQTWPRTRHRLYDNRPASAPNWSPRWPIGSPSASPPPQAIKHDHPT
jgi:cyclopropane-fatty-acyl-phospholipid synthase